MLKISNLQQQQMFLGETAMSRAVRLRCCGATTAGIKGVFMEDVLHVLAAGCDGLFKRHRHAEGAPAASDNVRADLSPRRTDEIVHSGTTPAGEPWLADTDQSSVVRQGD